jgi:peptidoglycan/LPS O-acetylase OafA/YrhL
MYCYLIVLFNKAIKMEYRKEIDGLRALAVLPVIFFHAGFAWCGGGYVGVDIFFVISGYLITTLIISEKQAGTFSLKRFYARRAWRILPALYCVTTASLLIGYWWLDSKSLEELTQSILAVLGFVSNIHFYQQSGYFDSDAELKPLLHMWSLAVEEQYYIMFPLLFLGLWRLGKRWLIPILVVLASFSMGYGLWHYLLNPEKGFYLLQARAWELFIGVFVALASAHLSTSSKTTTRSHTMIDDILACIGITMMIAAIVTFNENTPYPSPYALLPTIGTALVLLCAHQHTLIGRALSNRLLVGIGLISYSAYLWHQPLFAFARHLSIGSPGMPMLCALILATLMLAYVTWRWVEQPFRAKTPSLFNKNYALLAALLCLLSLSTMAAYANLKLPHLRLSRTQRNMLATATTSPLKEKCHSDNKHVIHPQDACQYFGSHVTWATFGDSHSVELAYALAKELEKENIGLKQFSFYYCHPIYGRDYPYSSCTKWTNESADYLIQNQDIKTVVVAYRLNVSLFGKHSKTYPTLPNTVSAKDRQLRWQSYVDLITALHASGKRVIVVLQAPEMIKTIEALIYRYGRNNKDIVGMSKQWWEKRNQYVRDHLHELPKDVLIIDPADFLCQGDDCYAIKRSVSFYFDDNHMSPSGAAMVAKGMMNQLRE